MSTAAGSVTAAAVPYRSRREVDQVVKNRILIQARLSDATAPNCMSTHLVTEIETTKVGDYNTMNNSTRKEGGRQSKGNGRESTEVNGIGELLT
jgi:hypothetical protein